MADYPLENAIEGLRQLIREKNELNEVAAEKIQRLTAELQDTDGSSPPINPIDKIQEGFMNFRINQFERYPCLYDQLAKDQTPHFLVFACSDSRVSPTFILNFIPGKAFMARNIANLVPPFDFDKQWNVQLLAVQQWNVQLLAVQKWNVQLLAVQQWNVQLLAVQQ